MNTWRRHIMNELRGWGHDWLEGFRGIRQQQVDLGSYVPYPSHPLPVGFPFGDFSLSHTFEWVHEYGTEQLRHIHHVDFVFQGRTNGPGSSIGWSVVDSEGRLFLAPPTGSMIAHSVFFADGTELGVFEIAGPIYDTAVLPFTIDTDLVLEAMSASLGERMPVHLASRVVPVHVHPNQLPRPLRIYELRTSDQTAIRTLGTRWEA
ncbi:hypothetical protein B0H13DRAFT_1887231 [Mycena leptocephala]|nr:hypothetical protein B0H13DRAFT_1887231 [Mycena leptocephala]